MRFLTAISILCFCVLAYSRPPQKISKVLVEKFVTCLRKQMHTGNEELDLPSYNPYVQPYTFTTNTSISPNVQSYFSIENVKWEGLADFTYSIVEIPTPADSKNSQFHVIIHWNKLAATGIWRRHRNYYGFRENVNGHFSINCSDRIRDVNITLSPDQIINMSFKSTVDHVQVKVTNMGDEKQVFEPFAAYFWKSFINSKLFGRFLGAFRMDYYNREWLSQPTKIEKLFQICD